MNTLQGQFSQILKNVSGENNQKMMSNTFMPQMSSKGMGQSNLLDLSMSGTSNSNNVGTSMANSSSGPWLPPNGSMSQMNVSNMPSSMQQGMGQSDFSQIGSSSMQQPFNSMGGLNNNGGSMANTMAGMMQNGPYTGGQMSFSGPPVQQISGMSHQGSHHGLSSPLQPVSVSDAFMSGNSNNINGNMMPNNGTGTMVPYVGNGSNTNNAVAQQSAATAAGNKSPIKRAQGLLSNNTFKIGVIVAMVVIGAVAYVFFTRMKKGGFGKGNKKKSGDSEEEEEDIEEENHNRMNRRSRQGDDEDTGGMMKAKMNPLPTNRQGPVRRPLGGSMNPPPVRDPSVLAPSRNGGSSLEKPIPPHLIGEGRQNPNMNPNYQGDGQHQTADRSQIRQQHGYDQQQGGQYPPGQGGGQYPPGQDPRMYQQKGYPQQRPQQQHADPVVANAINQGFSSSIPHSVINKTPSPQVAAQLQEIRSGQYPSPSQIMQGQQQQPPYPGGNNGYGYSQNQPQGISVGTLPVYGPQYNPKQQLTQQQQMIQQQAQQQVYQQWAQQQMPIGQQQQIPINQQPMMQGMPQPMPQGMPQQQQQPMMQGVPQPMPQGMPQQQQQPMMQGMPQGMGQQIPQQQIIPQQQPPMMQGMAQGMPQQIPSQQQQQPMNQPPPQQSPSRM